MRNLLWSFFVCRLGKFLFEEKLPKLAHFVCSFVVFCPWQRTLSAACKILAYCIFCKMMKWIFNSDRYQSVLEISILAISWSQIETWRWICFAFLGLRFIIMELTRQIISLKPEAVFLAASNWLKKVLNQLVDSNVMFFILRFIFWGFYTITN